MRKQKPTSKTHEGNYTKMDSHQNQQLQEFNLEEKNNLKIKCV